MKRAHLLGSMAMLAGAGVALAAFFLFMRFALTPVAGEWSVAVSRGPVRLEVGIPSVIRLATTTWFAPFLDGHTIDTGFGPVELGWDAPAQTLTLRCAPCHIDVPGLGEHPVRVAQLRVTLHRYVDQLNGMLEVTPIGMADSTDRADDAQIPPLRGHWSGHLSQKALQLNADAIEGPIAQWYALLVPHLPELQHARIGGTLRLRAQWHLPEHTFKLQAKATQFTVRGLGIQPLLDARPVCDKPHQLTANSWLTRAVVAAEDPRFLLRHGLSFDDIVPLLADMSPATPSRVPSLTTRLVASLVKQKEAPPVERALREFLYVTQVEQTLGKEGVVLDLLSHARWGPKACGAEAAARRYFHCSAHVLTPAQALWLATMLHDSDKALARWQDHGDIDLTRTRTIAQAMRDIGREQREALVQSVATASYRPPR